MKTLVIAFLFIPLMLVAQPDKIYGTMEEAMANFEKVYILDLGGAQSEDFDLEKEKKLFMDEIGKMTRLTELSVTSLVSALPADIGNLTNLTTLYIAYSGLSTLPAEIGNLTSLTTLNLSGNQLTSLTAEIGNLTKLTELNLENNNLKSLPTEVENLTNLTKLDLGGNQLTSLPVEIGNLTNLTQLDLGDNQLTTLPAEIGNLTKLTELNLENNNLESLPTEVGNLTNLTELDLGDNQLTTLPAEIGNLTKLKYILGIRSNNFSGAELEKIESWFAYSIRTNWDNLNLYYNCGNEISIYIPNTVTPSYEITGGDLIKGSGGGMIFIIPKEWSVNLKVIVDNQIVTQRDFSVIPIPPPTIELTVEEVKLKNSQEWTSPGPQDINIRVRPDNSFGEHLPKDAVYRIFEWEVLLVRKEEVIHKTATEKPQDLITLKEFHGYAKPGDKYVIIVKKVNRRSFRGLIEEVDQLQNPIWEISLN